LEVTDLEAGYGMSRVLFGVSLRVRRGRWWRSWDATGWEIPTLKAIGILPATRVVLDGRDVSRVPSHLIARAGVGYVPQDRRIFPISRSARTWR
jgi:branched-chain amino acid transport system ATP-binding protein